MRLRKSSSSKPSDGTYVYLVNYIKLRVELKHVESGEPARSSERVKPDGVTCDGWIALPTGTSHWSNYARAHFHNRYSNRVINEAVVHRKAGACERVVLKGVANARARV